MHAIIGFIVAYFLRWFPHSVEPGLRKVGNPDAESPVLVTGNFSLTLKRVLQGIRGRDLWLLVAPSKGINVWCAACGGDFTYHSVISAVKTSELAEKVKHHTLILPPLSAAGMDIRAIKEQTGFRGKFGPVYARDIPAYLDAGMKKTEPMMRFRFDLRHRLDMLLSNNTILYLIPALFVFIFAREHFTGFSALFLGITVYLYLLFPWIPGRTGWSKSIYSALVLCLAIAGFGWWNQGSLFSHWGWMITGAVIFMTVGFDAAGICAAMPSDVEALLARMGIKNIGSFLHEKELGGISLERSLCTGDMICHDICPVGVYGPLDEEKKITLPHTEMCFGCGACVKQCPYQALNLTPSAG